MKWAVGPNSFFLAFLRRILGLLTPETIKKERKLKTEGHELRVNVIPASHGTGGDVLCCFLRTTAHRSLCPQPPCREPTTFPQESALTAALW